MTTRPDPTCWQEALYQACPACGYQLCWMDRNFYDECPMCGTAYTAVSIDDLSGATMPQGRSSTQAPDSTPTPVTETELRAMWGDR